jgi:TPR repeat protein
MRVRSAAFALCLFVSQLAMGQATPAGITNSDVISMTKAGIGEQTIILAIQRGPDKFDTSPQALIALKVAGVSDQVLNAMLASDNSGGATSSVQTPAQGEEPSGNCSPAGADDATRAASYSCECNRGNMDACAKLGFYYRMGWGVSKNSSQARELFKRACDGGSGSGCQFQEAAAASATGSNSTQSEESSRSGSPADSSDEARVASYKRECDSGGMDACAKLGFYYRMGWGVPKDPSQATTLIKKACDAGSAIGCSLQKEYSSSESPSGQTGIRAANTNQGLTLKVLQEQSVPYVQESGGGVSTSCNIVGTANTSAYVNAYGNNTYGNATTNSNQRMTCNSYDTTISWPHVLNVMFVQASDGNSYIIACDRAWAWSKCVPLRAGDTFNARFTNRGLEVTAFNTKGKEKNPTYQILQSKSLR